MKAAQRDPSQADRTWCRALVRRRGTWRPDRNRPRCGVRAAAHLVVEVRLGFTSGCFVYDFFLSFFLARAYLGSEPWNATRRRCSRRRRRGPRRRPSAISPWPGHSVKKKQHQWRQQRKSSSRAIAGALPSWRAAAAFSSAPNAAGPPSPRRWLERSEIVWNV